MSLLIIIPAFLIVIAILTGLLEMLWNKTMPLAFSNAKQIDFWVAFRLLLIGAILTTGPIVSCQGHNVGSA